MVHEVRNQKRFLNELTDMLSHNGMIFIVEPKLHVSKTKFDAVVDLIKESGFSIAGRPKVFFSRAIVLEKQ
jgi:2-polyprenyl-3-methyl-5-hydroxy-6-metoxy-1,4-benzoquinol methylase